MTTADPQLTGPKPAYRVVGTSPAHHDFVDKVQGSLHYAADWQLPGMLLRPRGPQSCRAPGSPASTSARPGRCAASRRC